MSRRKRKSTYASRIGNMVGVTAALGSVGLGMWVLHAAVAWCFGGR